MIHALESPEHRDELKKIISEDPPDKVEKVLEVYKKCNAGEWALELKYKYLDEAMTHLSDIAVLSVRKEPLSKLAHYLVQREN